MPFRLGAHAPSPTPFPYDKERVRAGWYSDAYFLNAARILNRLNAERYRFSGKYAVLPTQRIDETNLMIGRIKTEMQFFTRREPWSIACGLSHALQVLKECAGCLDAPPNHHPNVQLDIRAVPEGARVAPWDPALVVRGEYRHFGFLETVLLGILARRTRIATNVYKSLEAANGKPIFFFSARFDAPETQAGDGYAYRVAVERYNTETRSEVPPFVSTQAQAELWGGRASGTVPHSYLLCFLRDSAEAMVHFARILPVTVKRIALVDVNNDCVADSLRAGEALFRHYCERLRAGDLEGAERYRLFAVRPDTADDMVDRSVSATGQRGVTADLIRALRNALDQAHERLGYSGADCELAAKYFPRIRIVATGGFHVEKIRRFEEEGVPVNMYGVGSSLLRGQNDFTADVVRVKAGDEWIPMAKEGRAPHPHAALKEVSLG